MRIAVVLAALAIVCTGCAAAPAEAPPEPPFSIVVLGDSLSVEPPHDCEGCTTYVTQFAQSTAEAIGDAVAVDNDAVQDTGIADTQQALDEYADDLEVADLVIVWIGTNDGPPWPSSTPCGHVDTSDVDSLLEGIEAYTPECLDATIAEYGEQYATLFTDVAAASPDARHLAFTTYDNWFNHPFLADSTFESDRIDAIVEKVAGTFDDWNVAQCAAAEAAGFECVDTYHLVNGVDGRRPGGALFAPDGTHLSQAGHDAVAELLTTLG